MLPNKNYIDNFYKRDLQYKLKPMHKQLTTVFLIVLLSVQAVSITDSQENLSTLPKLPLFIGKGYDILMGNPLSTEGVDSGFRHQIFSFSYTKNQTTEDGKYIIPDQMAHRKTTACSFSTQISQYRGTQSYQSDLKIKAQIGGGYTGPLFKASFSQSTTYQRVYNQTIKQNMSLTHASAECQCYEMSLNLFKPLPILSNFWEGVKYSYIMKNWDKFIQQFGTHYVYEIVMGGRAIQEIQYSSKSVSELQTIGIDINVAAKASFAKYHADASFDYHKYDTQIKYAQTVSQNINQIYIGGKPPKTGKIMDWQQQVIKDPMPITYKMILLSDLFQFNPNKTIDLNAVKTQFTQALDHYCALKNCHQPASDKPKPQPATVSISKTYPYGGGGGQPFSWSHVSPTFNARKIHIRSAVQVDNIQIELSDGVTTVLSPQFGGQGGNDRDPWVVPNGEHITQVQYRSGDRVDSLTFITNKGNKSPRYGGNGGQYHMETFPEDYRIIGMFGRNAARLDQLGFILGKTVYHNGVPTTITKNLILNDS